VGLKRRAFLQQAGLTLFALGISEAGLSLVADRYQQALAQPTNRKLALLVGINQYPEQVSDRSTHGTALNGCITDVQLQRELLIHRFGFQPSDILTLTDQQATREAIEAAFLAHLTEQARPGDVVLFHFSGFGSQVKLGEHGERVQNSLVPVDGVLPTEENPFINDLLEETLGLLLRSLPTEQVTAVLDTSYADPNRAIQGNLRVRSRPITPSGLPAPAELAFQQQLRDRVKISQEQSQAQWRTGQLPGIVLMAAGPNQVAAEGQWNGFNAGLFTYALTQHLWSAMPTRTLQVSLSLATGAVEQLVGKEQQPQIIGQKSQNQSLPPYYLKPDATTVADGVVTAVEEDGKTVRLWLAGLPAAVLENYGQNSLLALSSPTVLSNDKIQLELESVAPAEDASLSADKSVDKSVDKRLLQIRSREGVSVRARIYAASNPAPLQVGQLVQEAVRVLPRNIGLTVALDSSLERIERVDATSAFAAIPRVTAIAAGEQSADYVFGKTQLGTPTLAASLASPASQEGELQPSQPMNGDLPSPKSSYGLFHLGRSALLNTLSKEEEAVKTAVNRITPQLHTLLAAKLLRLTSNAESSRLGVRATLEMVAPQERIVMQRETPRAPWAAPTSRLAGLFMGDGIPNLPVDSRLQYRLCNYSDRPVYFILLGLDSSGNAIALFPTPAPVNNSLDFKAPPADTLLSPGEILLIPQSTPSDWTLQGPPGVVENYVIFSRAPLTHTYSALEIAMRSKGDARRVSALSNPLEVAQATLRDLNQASLMANSRADVATDTYALDVNNWATLSFVYQVAGGGE